MIDKDYCMSSYLAFRYIEKDGVDFYEGMHHKNRMLTADEDKIKINCADDIGNAIKERIDSLSDKKIGIMLSGGMDSAIIASYMPGCDAYTFRFLNGEFQNDELCRAEYYAKEYGLRLHYVDISWDTVERHIDALMKAKCCPVHSIEPQILEGALQAKADGVEVMLLGESADTVFGGLDGLLGRSWSFDEFVDRYSFINPFSVLQNPVSVNDVFKRYLDDDNKIDVVKFLNTVFITESTGSYFNAFGIAGIECSIPYADMTPVQPLDLARIRSGESKYMIRELMKKRYPDIPVPDKLPMPRPVDIYFKEYKGPVRPEFKPGLDMSLFTGNQKWQLYALERFLNTYEPLKR